MFSNHSIHFYYIEFQQFSATETVLSSIMDEIPSIRKTKLRMVAFRGCGCLLFFILGLPMTTQVTDIMLWGGEFIWYVFISLNVNNSYQNLVERGLLLSKQAFYIVIPMFVFLL